MVLLPQSRGFGERLRQLTCGAGMRAVSGVPAVLGVVLLIAAALKTHQLATSPTAETSLLTSRWFLIALVEFELALGLWLISWTYPKPARMASLVAFAAFAAASLIQVLSGESSCGCFGKVVIKPLYTLLFDLAALAVLWRWGPQATSDVRSHFFRLTASAFLFLLMGVSAALIMSSFTAAILTKEGEIVGDNATVVLEPETWSGQRFPLLKHIDIGERLERGSWMALLYRDECPVCRAEIEKYAQLARASDGQPDAPRLALIEVPPYGTEAVGADFSGVRGRLNDARDWFVETPVVVQLKDGNVTRVRAAQRRPLWAWTSDKTDKTAVTGTPAGHLSREWRELLSPVKPSQSVSGFPDYRRARRERFLSQIACGPMSLVAVLRYLDVPLTEEETESIRAAAGMKGANLLQLKGLAESHGLSALGVEVTPEKLKRMGLPAIVHLSGIGFAAALDYESEGIRLVYPLQPPRLVSDEDFTKAFGKTGRALLLSRKLLSPSSLGLGQPQERPVCDGPTLRLEQSAISVGCIHVQDWDASLVLHNDGKRMLRIKEVVPSCSCMKVAVEHDALPAGQSTTLRVKGMANAPGGFTHAIVLVTNQSEQSIVKVPVRGYVEPPVFLEQPALQMENVVENQSAQGEVALGLAGDIGFDSVQVTIPKGAPLAAEVYESADGSLRLRLRWQGSARSGWYR